MMQVFILMEVHKLNCYGLLCFQFVDSKPMEVKIDNFCQKEIKCHAVLSVFLYIIS